MVSKGGETKVRSSGTSIASKRAKEHSNRSSEQKVVMVRPEVPGSESSVGWPDVPWVAEKVSGKPGDFG